MSPYLSAYLSLSICKCGNEAILRDILKFWTWQHRKCNKSARFPHCSNLTTSKTKKVCETSLIFRDGRIKNEAILRDILQKWKVDCRASGLVPVRFAIFPLHLSKVLRLPRNSEARSYEVLHLSRKIILANLKIWCTKMRPFSGNQRPDLWLVCLLYCACHVTCIFADPAQKSHDCQRFWNCDKTLTFCSRCQGADSLAPATQNDASKSKSGANVYVLFILTSKRASRHNGMHFLNISTSKSAPRMVGLIHFDFDMCFAPQRRCNF